MFLFFFWGVSILHARPHLATHFTHPGQDLDSCANTPKRGYFLCKKRMSFMYMLNR